MAILHFSEHRDRGDIIRQLWTNVIRSGQPASCSLRVLLRARFRGCHRCVLAPCLCLSPRCYWSCCYPARCVRVLTSRRSLSSCAEIQSADDGKFDWTAAVRDRVVEVGPPSQLSLSPSLLRGWLWARCRFRAGSCVSTLLTSWPDLSLSTPSLGHPASHCSLACSIPTVSGLVA